MSIHIKLYVLENSNHVLKKELNIELNKTIYDLKQEILTTLFNHSHNDVEISNISDRVYKDYGLLFFDHGKLPGNIDYIKLEKFTIENRTFSFLVEPVNKTHVHVTPKVAPKNLFSKYRTIDKNKEHEESNTDNGRFIYVEEDFPSLT